MKTGTGKTFRPIGPTTYLSPIPAVMLGCADPENGHEANLITVAWTGVVCTKPPMVSVSIRKSRLSHEIIQQSGEFTLNLTGRALCRATDFCGVKSGRDVKKFEACGPHSRAAADSRARRGGSARLPVLPGEKRTGAGQPRPVSGGGGAGLRGG